MMVYIWTMEKNLDILGLMKLKKEKLFLEICF